jgi:hypothetical protein
MQCDCMMDNVEGIVKELVGIEKEYGMKDDEVVVYVLGTQSHG